MIATARMVLKLKEREQMDEWKPAEERKSVDRVMNRNYTHGEMVRSSNRVAYLG